MYAILGLCYTALTSAAPRRTWETDDLELLMQCSQSQEDPVDFALESLFDHTSLDFGISWSSILS
jgi:hypothetical protein